jgi:predicted dehydrogenase
MKLRVAVVGLGWVSTHRHIPAMRRNRHYEIVGLVDRTPGRACAEAVKLGCRRFSEEAELDKVPWLEEVDAVTIGTSPFSHFQLIKSALLRGKHVLTEKPFAMSVREGEELVELAGTRGRTLAIVHNFQFARSTGKLQADIERGHLGRIRRIVGCQWSNPGRRLPDWYNQLPLGLFYDESPHLLYLLRCLAPGALRLLDCAIVPSIGGEATPASIVAHYSCADASGQTVPVQLNMTFDTPLSEWHMFVMGEEAMGAIDLFRDIYIRLPNDGLHTTTTVFRTSLQATAQHWLRHLPNGWRHLTGRLMYGNEEVFKRFAQAAVDCRQPEGIGGDDALAVLRMQHLICDNGRRVDGIPV